MLEEQNKKQWPDKGGKKLPLPILEGAQRYFGFTGIKQALSCWCNFGTAPKKREALHSCLPLRVFVLVVVPPLHSPGGMCRWRWARGFSCSHLSPVSLGQPLLGSSSAGASAGAPGAGIPWQILLWDKLLSWLQEWGVGSFKARVPAEWNQEFFCWDTEKLFLPCLTTMILVIFWIICSSWGKAESVAAESTFSWWLYLQIPHLGSVPRGALEYFPFSLSSFLPKHFTQS